ncbi:MULTISPECIES: amidohydrolase [unclassified Rhizobium]|uniref:amidohydrolase family protein n=1 Tax=unclassified Rhizobium TaxID=2613769 RepID=UPI000DDD5AAF|nr:MULTISPECIES: amidohydrolase [unclassified Rhizobium]MBB3289860.1 putative TIM-barrel fold metal-dependent hydrolase [Rhizobium sp. BK252]MBB3404089.1 putative TIM-barrel fold metal-dependent hydrolase [Rhizobium sp. BK289]MBB3417188.1 putative TIM-barrel fold metal-dependent hydrolase [Rhizobium sp. BK284]MBB3485065.1 putative TIM-barrel fold metal-dependent hydrolase [Rhizobium sp. BK347]MDK4722686.1 amidohydrolase [Rhizobium sp. CNPSo 3968]
MLFDSHLHIVDRNRLAYPWLAGAGTLNRDSLYEDYAREAKRLGITDTLHMEVDVAEDDIERETDYVKDLSREPGSLLRGAIAACRPESTNFPAYLERVLADPFVKGFRRVLHVVPDDVSEGALFRENLKQLGGTPLTFDLCVLPHQMSKALVLIDLNPNIRFVLDHCGVPAVKDGFSESWAAGITEAAKRPNVIVKISGVVAYADPDSWTPETLRPFVEHCIASFGWDRVIWGSDWPVCTLGGNLSTWVAATHTLMQGVSNDERNRLYHLNAKRLWSL